MPRSTTIAMTLAATLLAACGGGGNGEEVSSPPPDTSVVGQFKDANVEGLSFRTASRAGTTDEAGRFFYEPGETVSFHLGGVELGAAPAQPVITPLDLVPDGRSDAVAVLDIVRFLMLLDRDGDPANGLSISPAVQAAASGWGPMAFGAPDFAEALAGVAADIAAADGRTPVIPETGAARAHLEATVYCMTSGVYLGQYSGSRSGIMLLMRRPGSGQWTAEMVGAGGLFAGPPNPPADRTHGFDLLRAADGARLSGRLVAGAGAAAVVGTWQLGEESGEFTAEPVLASPSATYRFTGTFWYDGEPPNLQQFNVFEVDARGRVFSRFGHFSSGDIGTGSGQLRNGTISWTASTGSAGEGAVNFATMSVLGTWVGTPRTGGFEATGCRLN